jgi:LacI family transcriptional regulator
LVSEHLREGVARAAADLGYVPNAAARALAARRSGIIGVIAGSLEDVVTRRATEGLSRRLDSAGYAVHLATASGDATSTVRLVDQMLARGADALALVGVDLPENPASLRVGRAPMACLDQSTPGGEFAPFVRAQAMELAIRFLRELGHRRIGVVAPGRACGIGAIRDALAEADVSLVGLSDEVEREPQLTSAETLARWLALPDPPTALACGSDLVAAAALRECEVHGIAVPRRLSIIGFGDTELARHTRPMLSTLRIPAAEAGVAAADFLLAALRGEAFAAPRLGTKVVARDSTCPAGNPLERGESI